MGPIQIEQVTNHPILVKGEIERERESLMHSIVFEWKHEESYLSHNLSPML